MKRTLLHIALLICSAFAVASACKDGTRDVIKGTRCRKYAECQNGSWHLKECKIGQLFDANTLRCASVREMGRCADGLKCSEGRSYSHLGSNNLYYRCINGRITVQVCGVGQIFDHDLQNCRPDQVIQHKGLHRAKRDADKACQDGNRHRNGKSCRDYIECINGQEVMKTCPDCMNFDNNTQTCRFVFVVPCADTMTSTTQQPTTASKPTDPPTTEPPTTPKPTDSPTTPQPTDSPTESPLPDSTTPQPTDSPTESPLPDSTTPQPTGSPTESPLPDSTTPQPTDSPTESPLPDSTTPQPTDSPTESPLPDSTTPKAETTILPSSTVAPCKDGDKVGLVDPECKSYQECKNGVWVNDACGWMRKFDAIKKECEYTMWNTVICAK